MYCANCGAQASERADFCPACGSGTRPARPETPQPAGRRGFSPRIRDPAFARYIKSANRWSAFLSLLLAAVAVTGFYLYGKVGSNMGGPAPRRIGFVIGGMFLLAALFQILGGTHGATWDGVVESKRIKKKTARQGYGKDGVRCGGDLLYCVVIRSDLGKKHVIKTKNSDALYHYFHVGDRVRRHGGLKSFEKYDKTGDRFLPCSACGALCDIREEACFRCKCPLLK